MKRLYLALEISLLFLIILFIISCAVNPVTGKKQIMLMSESQEVALGISYDPQVLATFGVYQDDNLQNFGQTK